MSVFGRTPFYHETIVKFITAFGELFSDITIQKRDANGAKKQVYSVPIEYAPKNKWVSRVREQNDLAANQVKITLPRMAFEMVDIRYAPDRKIGVNGVYALGTANGMRGKVYPPTPYDCIFNLYVMTKDQGDSLQVLEQILPYFQPYMTIVYEILPEYGISKDVPITLQAYQTEDTYEGSPEEQRTVTQIFTFAAQMDFFGPTVLNSAIIKNINIYLGENPITPRTVNIRVVVDPPSANKSDPHTETITITETI